MRDIDKIIARLTSRYPNIQIKQIKVSHVADDDGVWFVNVPGLSGEIQIESPFGQCPFTIESDFKDKAFSSVTIEDTVAKIEALIEFEMNIGEPKIQ